MKENDVRETPRALFDELNREFHFTLDACATHANALCDRYFTLGGLFVRGEQHGTPDGLQGSWAGQSVWCNPPFSEIHRWTAKAWSEASRTSGIVMLVPANRTYATWWQEDVAPHIKHPCFDVRWRAVRDKFTVDGKPILNKKGGIGSPSFSCALLIWK